LEFIKLNVSARSTKGNGPARVLRRDGKIPAVLYGPKTSPQMLQVATADLELALKNSKGSQAILDLIVNDGESSSTHPAMVKELQTHPISGAFLHADFYEVAADRKIRVMVPVIAEGKAKGVEFGGMLQVIRRELEILCLPQDAPESIVIDVTEMDIGESIHREEVSLPENVELPPDVNFTVVTILGGKGSKDEEAAEGEEEGEEAAAD